MTQAEIMDTLDSIQQQSIIVSKWLSEQVDKKEQSVPLGEQVWKAEGVASNDGTYRILHSDIVLCYAYSPEMRDIIMGIPGLVKVCEEYVSHPEYGSRDPIRDALKAMANP